MTNYTMKELPDSEKPYEKALRYGVSSLSDAQLLAVILRTGSKEMNAVEIAQMLLQNGQKNLLNLEYFSLEEFMKIPGIGKVKGIQLKAIAELSRRISQTRYLHLMKVDEPKTIAAYYMEQLRHEKREQLILVMFDTKNFFLGDEILSIGTINASLVSPREIFVKALQKQAVNIMLLHNHPSGDSTPSQADLTTTKQIMDCGDMLGIHLVDHLIIGDSCYTSLRETGIIN